MITGGTGSFGNTVLKHFLETDIRQIRIFSRDEKKQDDMRHELQAKHPDAAKKVKFYVGDVRDPRSIADAMPGVDYIFHAAALKQVPSCEFFPMQAVKTNVEGTDNVLHAAVDAGVKRVVCLSTDKAAYPINAIGISKAMMEHVIYANARVAAERGGTVICCTRYGNVMCSRGSVIPLFIDQIHAGSPITVNDPSVELEVLFVDDLIDEMFDAMEGRPHRCEYPAAGEDGFDGLTPKPAEEGKYCYAPVTHKTTLGYIVECLHRFHDQPQTLLMPAIAPGSFEKKLYSMYLSYLPKDKVAFDLKMNCDARGSFTELLKTADHGQFSVNISKPGITKGQHWHNSKWEFFIVISGHGLIQERKIGTDEVLEFEVSGDQIRAVHMLPGYTHNIINLSETENLVTLMWANEIFDPNHPDTFGEPV